MKTKHPQKRIIVSYVAKKVTRSPTMPRTGCVHVPDP